MRQNVDRFIVPIVINKEGEAAFNQALYFHQVFLLRITIRHTVTLAQIINRIFKHKEYKMRIKRGQKKSAEFVIFF